MTDKKQTPTAITVPRSFAALAKVVSSAKDLDPARAYLRTVRVEALARGRVRGVAMDGFALLRIEADAPTVNLDLFGGVTPAAPAGTILAAGGDDIAVVARAVKVPKDGEPPPVEIVIGPDGATVRCGSESRRVQVDGGAVGATWPAADPCDWIPTGDVVCAQLVSAERLRDLLSAVVAAGVESVTVEMRGGDVPLCLRGVGEFGEAVTGIVMPMRSKSGGAADDDREVWDRAVQEGAVEAARAIGCEAEVTKG